MTKKIKIGNIYIGANEDIKIQSMTNTKTYDVENTIKQILELEKIGCDIIRVSVPDQKSAEAIKDIKSKINIPLVADIHFDYRLAIASIENGVDKIRFNPGNIGDLNRVKYLVDAAKMHSVPIRVGVNSGSIEKEFRHQKIEEALCNSAMKHISLLEKYGFYDCVISVKASSVKDTINAYRFISKKCNYPLHLGVTEAGLYEDSVIKSSIGIGSLLFDNIGDTIRVSITGDPKLEIETAKSILKSLGKYKKPYVDVVSCPTCARTEIPIQELAQKIKNAVSNINKNLKIAVMGCIVNGPGEAINSDFGVAGGKDKSIIFSKGKTLKSVKNDILIEELLKLIKEFTNE